MMKLDEAIAALKIHARQLEAVQTIAAAINKAKDIDNLTQEAEQRRVARQKEVDAASAELTNVQAEIDAAKKAFADQKAKGEAAIAMANAKANVIVNDAQQFADGIVEKAKAQADSILQPVRDAADAKQREVNDLNTLAKALDTQISAKSAELDAINAQIEKARDLLKGFMVQ